MAWTKPFDDTVLTRAKQDRVFREGLLAAAIQELSQNNLTVARALLRHYINATVGFERLAAQTGKSPKSLMRMFSPSGNPTLSNLAQVLAVLQAETGTEISVDVRPR